MANKLKKSGKSAKCAWQFNEEQDVPGHIVPLCPRIMDRGVFYYPKFGLDHDLYPAYM